MAFAVTLCLLGMSEATPRKSHKQGCLNMSWPMSTQIGTLMWFEKSSWGHSTIRRPMVNKEGYKWEQQPSPGKNTLCLLFNTKWSALEAYIKITLHKLSWLHLCIWEYTYKHVPIHMHVHTLMYMHVTILKKNVLVFEREQGGYMVGFGRKKEKGGAMLL